MLQQSVEDLLKAIRDPDSTEEQINMANDAFLEAFENFSIDKANEALIALTQAFDCKDPARVGFMASLCSCLVDEGCDPGLLGGPLVKILAELLESCSRLFDACDTAIQKDVSTEDGGEDENCFEEIRLQKSGQMPQEALAWDTLNRLWPAAISFFESSAEFRNAAKSLVPVAKKLSFDHDGAHWIYFMVSVLADEPILVLEPPTQFGFIGRMSGIVDNFQLHTFLMDVFPRKRFLPRKNITRFVRSVIDGTGPQQTQEIVSGKWNMYTWKALRADLTLPDATSYDSSDDWIWGEGVPADIDIWQGYRVILLGPLSYQRTWRLQRMFDGLPARVDIEKTLSKEEVKQWLQKIATTNRQVNPDTRG